jgi:hypothetical protein
VNSTKSPHETLCARLPSPTRATLPAHFNILYFIT